MARQWTEEQKKFIESFLRRNPVKDSVHFDEIRTMCMGFFLLRPEKPRLADSLIQQYAQTAEKLFAERIDTWVDEMKLAGAEAFDSDLKIQDFVGRIDAIRHSVLTDMEGVYSDLGQRVFSIKKIPVEDVPDMAAPDPALIEKYNLLFVEAQRNAEYQMDAGYDFYLWRNLVRAGYMGLRPVEPLLGPQVLEMITGFTEKYLVSGDTDPELYKSFPQSAGMEYTASIEPVEWDGVMFSPGYEEAFQLLSNVSHNFYVAVFEAYDRTAQKLGLEVSADDLVTFQHEFFFNISRLCCTITRDFLRQLREHSQKAGNYRFYKSPAVRGS